jgi:hypothetical protein
MPRRKHRTLPACRRDSKCCFRHPHTGRHLVSCRSCYVRSLLHLRHRRRLEQIGNVDIRVGRRAAEVIMVRERRHMWGVLDRRPRGGDLRQPIDVGGHIGHSKLRSRYAGCYGASKRKPLVQIRLCRPRFGIAQVTIEHIDLVANLEILQAIAQSLRHKIGFVRRSRRGIGPHPDAIQARPVCCFQKRRQVPHSFGGDGVILRFRFTHHFANLRVLGFRGNPALASNKQTRWCYHPGAILREPSRP